MRPLELTVTGLRSHRTTTRVTFPKDWRLAAVVGPTGAGKSSLLEAIVYALFGSGTVPGASQPTNLITDDSREMRVVFRFGIGSECFEIVRTYRRVGNLQPVLKAADRTYSGAKEVEEVVARILGLRQEAFCSTVLLPQGRFATLLQAGSVAQKETLDAFFRLMEVTDVAGRLVAAAAALVGRRREVEAVRAQLPSDPAAMVDAAEQRLRQAEHDRAAADQLVDLVARYEQAAMVAENQAGVARHRADELSTAADALDKIAAAGARLEALEAELASAEAVLAERTELAANDLREAREELGVLDAPGVEACAARVDALLALLGAASAARDEAAAMAANAEQARVALEQIRTECRRVLDEFDHSRTDHELASAVDTSARTVVERLRHLSDESRRSTTARDAAVSRQAAAMRDYELAQEAEQEARDRFIAASERMAVANDVATTARTALAEAQVEATVAMERAEHLGTLGREVAERRAARDQANEALLSTRFALEQARTIVDAAVQAETQAEARWQQARALSHDARRHDAAAAAAIGRGPGDPCPICIRVLPDDFVSPAPSASTTDAEAAEHTTHGELASRRRATTRAETDLDARVREDAGAAERLSVAETALTEVEGLLVTEDSVEGIERAVAAADAHRERLENDRRTEQAASRDLIEARAEHGAVQRNIEPLAAATGRARAGLESATEDRDHSTRAADEAWEAFSQAGGDDAVAKAALELSTATDALAINATKLESAGASAREAEARLAGAEQEIAGLDAAAHAAAAQHRRAASAVTEALTTIPTQARRNCGDDPEATAEAANIWVTERRVLIIGAERRRSEAEGALDRARHAAADLRRRRVAELDTPLADAASGAARLAASVDVPSPPAPTSPAGLNAWAAAALAEARTRATDRQRDARAADAEAESTRVAARAACETSGIDPARLHEWRAEVLREVGAATESRCRATETAKRTSALDRALSTSAERARLLSLARDLCQGRESFANHVLVARRQGLIAEAAAILAELSNGRLTFAEDVAATFSVLDTGTGAVRDPRLLSGGEQFQASLALALGLVEIAARAGSRIECLFLDEGFGALDGASLDIALDSLEAAARRGRRIIAVTHVDAVTARADQVLAVSGSNSGSRAAWRTPELSVVV